MTAPSRLSDPPLVHVPVPVAVPAPSAEAAPRPAPARPARVARVFRRGVVTVACELRTPRVVQFYRRDFTAISHWLDALDRARDFTHVDTRAAREAEHVISAHLQVLQALFDDAVRRAESLLAAQGLAGVPIRYAAPVTVSAPIVHPVAHAYLRVLSIADDAFSGIERAWLLGLVDTRFRRREEARFRKALRSITTLVREQYGAMARVLREAREARAPEDVPADPPDGVSDAGPGPAGENPPWWQASGEPDVNAAR